MLARRIVSLAVLAAASLAAMNPVPRPAPDLQIVDPSGKQISLSSYRGKVVLVQFLFTTCPHCAETARFYSALQNELGPRGLQVVGVAFNPPVRIHPEMIRAFIEANRVTFPVGSAPQQDVLKYLGISVIQNYPVPMIVAIDRSGTIRDQSELIGYPRLQVESYLRPFLEKLLAEKPTARR